MSTDISKRQLEIIEAAGKILTEKGINGLTTKKLAQEMNFSESALYRHFTSKEEIIVSMLNYLALNMDQHSIELENKNPIEQLKNFFQNQFRFFESQPYFVIAVFSEGLLEESEKINQAIKNLMNKRMQLLKPIIQIGQEKGAITNDLDSDELIHILMGSVRLFMLKWRMSKFEFDIQTEGNKMLTSILKLIQTK
jgi:TetR/AcrR family transcriptional regulator, fatty acid metabolism regulator protein